MDTKPTATRAIQRQPVSNCDDLRASCKVDVLSVPASEAAACQARVSCSGRQSRGSLSNSCCMHMQPINNSCIFNSTHLTAADT